MMDRIIRNMTAVVLCAFLVSASVAQPNSPSPTSSAEKKEKKPYRILTSGKKITVQSVKNIRTVLVWTASGDRIIEQQELNVSSYSFETPAKEKIFFLRLELDNGRVYTEKVGVQ